ncbi:MAG TPA: hypothetical protein VGS07_04780 [Thermoanaerobaculia bacterium]|jgi:hypothetical protein|nr:hypothetical protein [Thermoanaerobaculia bacterium]
MRDITLRLTLVALGLAIVPGAQGAGAQVQKAWGPVPAPQDGVFVEAAPRTDGTVLAATGNAVFLVGPGGVLKPLGSGDRAVIDPTGGAYGLWKQQSFEIFDASGTRIGSLPAPPLSRFKLSAGGKVVYAPRIEVRREEPWVESLRLVRPDGTALAELPAAGLEISRLEADRIVYTLPSSLTARTLDGKELWSAGLRVHKFESAADRTILVPRPGRVVHLDKGQQLAETPVEGVVWNLAIAPDGWLSAATTRTLLYIFQDGKRTAQVQLPVTSASSLAVSERGLVLVGGQGPRGEGHLLLYDRLGKLLWQGETGVDRGGYRPAVRFAPGGTRFAVLEELGLTVYDVQGSQP